MRYKKKFHKRKPREKQMSGLAVKVYNNNVELALKKLKKKVKDSNLFLELKKKQYLMLLLELLKINQWKSIEVVEDK